MNKQGIINCNLVRLYSPKWRFCLFLPDKDLSSPSVNISKSDYNFCQIKTIILIILTRAGSRICRGGGRVSKLGENWLIKPQNRLNLHDLAVKRGGAGTGSAYTWIPHAYTFFTPGNIFLRFHSGCDMIHFLFQRCMTRD